jgi:hypothetical protein
MRLFLPFVITVVLSFFGCAQAQKSGLTITGNSSLEKGKYGYILHDSEGKVLESGYLTEEEKGKDKTLNCKDFPVNLSLIRRGVESDGKNLGMDILTFTDLKQSSELSFPNFTELEYIPPVELNYTIKVNSEVEQAFFSNDYGKPVNINKVEEGWQIRFKYDPTITGYLFLKMKYEDSFRCIKVSDNQDKELNLSDLEKTLDAVKLPLPYDAIYNGKISIAEDGTILYNIPRNMETNAAAEVLIPESLVENIFEMDFLIIPADQRNQMLDRRITRILRKQKLPFKSLEPSKGFLQKEYVTEGGFKVKCSKGNDAFYAAYGVNIPEEGGIPSVRNRSQWQIFGPMSEKEELEVTLPEFPKELLDHFTGGKYLRVFNAASVHLYKYENTPGDDAWKYPNELQKGNLKGHENRMEYRAWIKELN